MNFRFKYHEYIHLEFINGGIRFHDNERHLVAEKVQGLPSPMNWEALKHLSYSSYLSLENFVCSSNKGLRFNSDAAFCK